MTSNPPNIAIIGAGPAGLAAGLLLHNHGIPFTIFERREKPTADELAQPSGMLDLHEESGIAAIKECGLYAEFLTLTGECSEANKIMDKNGNLLYADEGELSERPEISRHSLTKLLMSNLPASQIQWGHKLHSATTSPASTSNQIELDFGSLGKQTFNVVIGADGAWSKVRNLLTDDKPYYSGTHIMTLTIREITGKYPHLAELVGKGSFIALGSRCGVISQRGLQDSARLYVVLTTENEHFAATTGLAGQTAVVVKNMVLEDPRFFGTWSSKLKELVAIACEEEAADHPEDAVDIRPMYILPVSHAWEHKPGVTLIGDAAHLMCPWAGEGVNLAMWDSLLLAHAIIKAFDTAGNDATAFRNVLDPLMKEFEADTVVRAGTKAAETLANGQMMFGDNGAQALANFFLSAGPPPE